MSCEFPRKLLQLPSVVLAILNNSTRIRKAAGTRRWVSVAFGFLRYFRFHLSTCIGLTHFPGRCGFKPHLPREMGHNFPILRKSCCISINLLIKFHKIANIHRARVELCCPLCRRFLCQCRQVCCVYRVLDRIIPKSVR